MSGLTSHEGDGRSGDRDRLGLWMESPEGILPLPGRHVTDHQMRLYMTFRQIDGPAVAAAKASISTATAYRYERTHQLRWSLFFGQVVKLGSPDEKDGPDDGQAEAVWS